MSQDSVTQMWRKLRPLVTQHVERKLAGGALTALRPHELSGEYHTGLLVWSRIDFSESNVTDLRTPEATAGHLLAVGSTGYVTYLDPGDLGGGGSLAVHALSGAYHSGLLDWDDIDFSGSNVFDLKHEGTTGNMLRLGASGVIGSIHASSYYYTGEKVVLTNSSGVALANGFTAGANGLSTSGPLNLSIATDITFSSSFNNIIGLQLSMIPAGGAASGQIAVSDGLYWYYADPDDVFDPGSGMITHNLDSSWHTGLLNWAQINFASSDVRSIRALSSTAGDLLAVSPTGYITYVDPDTLGGGGLTAHTLSGAYHTGLLTWSKIDFSASDVRNVKTPGATSGYLLAASGTGYVTYVDPGTLSGGGLTAHALSGAYHTGLLTWSKIDFSASDVRNVKTPGATSGYLLAASASGYVTYVNPAGVGGGSMTAHELSGVYHFGLLDWDDISFANSDIRDIKSPGTTNSVLIDNGTYVGYELPVASAIGTDNEKLLRPDGGMIRLEILRATDRVGETWVSLTPASGWSATNVKYKQFGDMIFLQGTLTRSGGSLTNILTLPTAIRPGKEVVFVTNGGYGGSFLNTGGAWGLKFDLSGVLSASPILQPAGETLSIISLDGINYSTSV